LEHGLVLKPILSAIRATSFLLAIFWEMGKSRLAISRASGISTTLDGNCPASSLIAAMKTGKWFKADRTRFSGGSPC
jgi:hypothetical protein